ncbi:MAG: hypothetical protein OEV18_14815 [Deltaproteobacteria bacterium]|nr:hypothetical protein [Deltaproteobacteria bacterium]
MKIRMIFVVSWLLLLSSVTNGYCESPGSQSYTPTKLEWFEVYLNAKYSEDRLRAEGYSIEFDIDRKTDTVIIWVFYLSSVDREHLNKRLDALRTLVKTAAKYYGWESWIKVTEKLHLNQ